MFPVTEPTLFSSLSMSPSVISVRKCDDVAVLFSCVCVLTFMVGDDESVEIFMFSPALPMDPFAVNRTVIVLSISSSSPSALMIFSGGRSLRRIKFPFVIFNELMLISLPLLARIGDDTSLPSAPSSNPSTVLRPFSVTFDSSIVLTVLFENRSISE